MFAWVASTQVAAGGVVHGFGVQTFTHAPFAQAPPGTAEQSTSAGVP
jgi:hypothetical protein